MKFIFIFGVESVWETLWARGGKNFLGVTDEDQWAYLQGFGVFGDF